MNFLFASIRKGSLLINILLAVTLLFFALGQIGRVSPVELPIYGNLYEALLFVVIVLLIIKVKNFINISKDFLVKWIILFFGWLIISFVISAFWYKGEQNIIAVLYLVRLIFYFLFFIYFSAYIKKYHSASFFYKIMVLSLSVLIIIFSLVQYFLYPNIGNLAYLGWDPHLYRLVGLFFDPPLTAAVFFLLGLFILFSEKNKAVKISIISILIVLFTLTYSRGGFLAILATLLIYSVRKMKFKYLLGFIAASAMLFLIIPKNVSEGLNLTRTASIKTRFIDYEKAITIWQKSPVIGIGYNHIRFEKDSFEEKPIVEKYNPSHASSSFHSSFLMILVTSGVIGLLIYLFLLRRIATIGDFAFYSIVFLSTYSFTDNLLLHPFILFLLFLLIPLEKVITHPSHNEQ